MEYTEDLEELIFNRARLLTDAEERESYLLVACGSNPTLERRVRALLQMLVDEDAFLETPVETATVLGRFYTEQVDYVGSSIGRYLLLEKIGAGGMGVVFRAEQTSPVRRQVALKIIRPEVDAPEMLDRFQSERQILARLQHPGVVQLLDAGTATDGRPWFVMELIQGMPVTKFCREHQLPLPDRLKLFQTVCDAVQHVHDRGVLHRDLKSSNVIVTRISDRWIPKVIDFGVACLTANSAAEKSLSPSQPDLWQSKGAVLIGTPACMSPEQTTMPDADLDGRCDVYALGVLLYELLTDQNLYRDIRWESMPYAEIVQTVREYSPCRPSEAISRYYSGKPAIEPNTHPGKPRTTSSRVLMLQGDLDSISMKAVQKNRDSRYSSVADLSEDIRRYLQHEPVKAAPSTVYYRMKKFAKRYKSRIAITALTFGFVSLLLAVFATTWSLQVQQRELARHKRSFEAQNQQSQEQSSTRLEHEYGKQIQSAYVAYFRGAIEQSRQRLAECAEESVAGIELGFEWRLLDQLCQSQPVILKGLDGKVFDVEFSPDSRLLVSCTGDRALGFNVWNTADSSLMHTVQDHENDVNSLAFTADGATLLTGGENRCVKSWNAEGWKEIVAARQKDFWMPAAQIHSVENSSKVIVAQVDWKTRIARTSVREFGSDLDQLVLENQRFLAANAAHDLAVFADNQGEICLRQITELGTVIRVLGSLASTLCGSISHDGRVVACGDTSGHVKLWRTLDGSERTLPKHGPGDYVIRDIAFSTDDQYLITAAHDGVVEIWDVASTTAVRVLHSKYGEAWSLAVSSDGDKFAVGYASGHIEIHRWTDAVRTRRGILTTGSPARGIVANPLRDRLAVLDSRAGTVQIHSVRDGSLLQTILAPGGHRLTATTFSSAGDSVWLYDETGTLSEFMLTTGLMNQQIETTPPATSSPYLLASDSRFAISDLYNPKFQPGIWDTISRQELARVVPVRQNEWTYIWGFFGNQSTVVSSGRSLFLWDFHRHQDFSPRYEASAHIAYVGALQKPSEVLMGLSDGAVHILDLSIKQIVATLEGHRGIVSASCVSNDGETIATGSRVGDVRLWRHSTYLPLCELGGLTGHIEGMWFTPDGGRLIAAAQTADGGAKVLVWDATGPATR